MEMQRRSPPLPVTCDSGSQCCDFRWCWAILDGGNEAGCVGRFCRRWYWAIGTIKDGPFSFIDSRSSRLNEGHNQVSSFHVSSIRICNRSRTAVVISTLDVKMESSEHLNKLQVGSIPTLYYIPDFISDSDQKLLLNHIYTAPVSKWKSLKRRRLQNWGGIVHEKGLLPQDLLPWLTKITERINEELRLFPSPINHVLINEYLPNQGIMPHQDGPAYFPVVAILSLGSPVIMDFTPH